jgi:serine protease Do
VVLGFAGGTVKVNIKSVAQQIVVSLAVVWVWKAFEGNPRKRWQEIYTVADHAVVAVSVFTPDGSSNGTGFVLISGKLPIIVTNQHVVGDSSSARVEFRGSVSTDADVLKVDRGLDLAVLRCRNLNIAQFSPLPVGRSEELRIGEELMTIGNPLHEVHHLSIGLYTGKEPLGGPDGEPMLRLNMPVDPGNSGGPLLDERGRVVGVLTLKDRRSSSIAFAIPIERLSLLTEPQ